MMQKEKRFSAPEVEDDKDEVEDDKDEDKDEQEMLRAAIAMSLEEQ